MLCKNVNNMLSAALQYNLPSTWAGMQKRGLAPELMAKWWSEAPARLAGIENQKGFIAEGLDADFVVSLILLLSPTGRGLSMSRTRV